MRGLQRPELGVDVVRRCVDLGELLAVALREQPRAAIIDAGLPWLDREVVGTLHDAGVRVVAVEVQPGSRPLDRIGVMLRVGAPPDVDAVVGLLHGLEAETVADEHPVGTRDVGPEHPGGADRSGGTLVAVWGGPGAPGRTSVAVHLSLELRRARGRVLLVDGDSWAPAVSQLLGLPTAPALTNAARDAANGWPNPLSESVVDGPGEVSVLGGLPRADLWPEVRDRTWRAVLDASRDEADVVIVDLASAIEEDEELSFDRVPFRRNLMTRVALAEADQIVMVFRADPIGLRHGIFAYRALRDALPDAAERVSVVLNRTPPSPHRVQECSSAVTEWTGRAPVALLPVEAAFERVVWEGRPLTEVAPRSRWLRELRATGGILR